MGYSPISFDNHSGIRAEFPDNFPVSRETEPENRRMETARGNRTDPGSETVSTANYPRQSPQTAGIPGRSRRTRKVRRLDGGERGIRTLGTLARSTVFETAPFNHSGTSPHQVKSAHITRPGLSIRHIAGKQDAGGGFSPPSAPPLHSAEKIAVTNA